MLHLALAINLLCALGAPPHFHRPNFPILAGWYPPGVQIALIPFSEKALRHFVYLERPENMALDDAEGFAALDHAEPLTDGRSLMAVQEDWATVGELYRGIELGFAHLVERDGEDEVFIGGRRDQARWQAFHWPEITPVVDLPSAQAAIEHIVEQGEGVRGEWKTAHFGTFLNVLNEYRAMREADPGVRARSGEHARLRARGRRRRRAGRADHRSADGADLGPLRQRRTRSRSRRWRATSSTRPRPAISWPCWRGPRDG